jgi:hypothetical protein
LFTPAFPRPSPRRLDASFLPRLPFLSFELLFETLLALFLLFPALLEVLELPFRFLLCSFVFLLPSAR